MKNVKKLLSTILAVVLLLSLVACGAKETPPAESETTKTEQNEATTTVPEDETFEFVMGTAVADTTSAYLAGVEFVNMVAENSNGTINIDFKPTQTLGEDTELVQQVMDGTLDFAIVSTGIFNAYTPLFDTLSIPFLLSNMEKEKEALLSQEMQDIYDAMEAYGLKVFGTYETGLRHIANNERPITCVDDLKGLKIRVLANDLMMNTFNNLGASPTVMAYAEVYNGLQGGAIDGIDMGIIPMDSMKYYEVAEYYSLVGLYPYPTAIIMNLDAYSKLSDSQKEVLQEAGKETTVFAIDYVMENEADVLASLEENGMKINTVEDVAEFQAATAPIYEEYINKDPLIKQFVDAWK